MGSTIFWIWPVITRLPKAIASGFRGIGGTEQERGDNLREHGYISGLAMTTVLPVPCPAIAEALDQILRDSQTLPSHPSCRRPTFLHHVPWQSDARSRAALARPRRTSRFGSDSPAFIATTRRRGRCTPDRCWQFTPRRSAASGHSRPQWLCSCCRWICASRGNHS